MTDVHGVNNGKNVGSHSQKLNTGYDEDLQAHGYTKSSVKTLFTYFSYILTLGCLRLFFHWYPTLWLYATHKKCSLEQATRVLIIDDYQGKYKSYFVKDVRIISTKSITTLTAVGLNDEDLVEKIYSKTLDLNLENGTKLKVREYRAITCKKQCYIWDPRKHEFTKLLGLDKHILCSDLHAEINIGLSREEQFLRRIVYGKNEIRVPVQSFTVLGILEFLNPFYIFQMFTLILWLLTGYYYYALAILGMSIFGVASSSWQARKNQLSLRNTVASTEIVKVLRENGTFENVSSSDLVPGDILLLPKYSGTVSADMILLSGTCIVNESMLTGESVPVTKSPLHRHPILYDSKTFNHHTLFCGTTIIQTKNYDDKPVLAKVIRTGLQTNKGSLVAAILYPPPTDFKFDQDSCKFLLLLSVIAFLGLSFVIYIQMSRGYSFLQSIPKALDIITIVIPPALPAVMTVGKMYAQSRLKEKQIFCINSRAINVAGSISCVCFDKTGTLTEDGLDLMGVITNENNRLGEPEKNVSKLNDHKIFEGMLVCHSLSLIDGRLSGDPLDFKMFESTNWILDEPKMSTVENKYDFEALMTVKPSGFDPLHSDKIPEIAIVQQYQFSSMLQRMSVIIQRLGDKAFKTYTKGSPEMILSLCRSETIPRDVTMTLQRYTQQGYRVIAFGGSDLAGPLTDILSISRDDVEKDLEFLGLIILENRVKMPTANVIREIRDANIKVLMITGDNIQTAVSVAKECGILNPDEAVITISVVQTDSKQPPQIYYNLDGPQNKSRSQKTFESLERGDVTHNYKFVITGTTWELLREHFFDLIPQICVRGAVFARMTSDQKKQLVVEIMQLGYYVAMCGDGANDCGALRAAHVGISLSEAESSVASPFTSRIPDITCVPIVIKQGRAALVTSFGIFKFMICYSLVEFASVIILSSMNSNLSDLEFLFIDVALAINFSFFFGKTQAYNGKLATKPPTMSLIGFTGLMSFILHMFIMTTLQLLVFYGVARQPWYIPTSISVSDPFVPSYENYSVFCISLFQYIILVIVFSKGEPYREPFYSNIMLMSSVIIMFLICSYVTISPSAWIAKALELQVPPNMEWRITIVGLIIINFILSTILESLIINWAIESEIKPRCFKPERSSKLYVRLEHELEMKTDWPPISFTKPLLPVTASAGTIVNSQGRYSANDLTILGQDNYAYESDSLVFKG